MKRIRLDTPENKASSCDYVAQSMLFYAMVPASDESMAEFHGRLVKQAKKCNFQCSDCPESNQKRNIRDRLLFCVAKDLQKEILRKFHNPTAEDIMNEHNSLKRFQRNPGWQIILSYLPLSDLINFERSHPKLAKIVEINLSKGLQVFIDDDTVWKYPPAQHAELYTEYLSRTTNISIDGVNRYDLIPLMQNIQHITQLTLRNVHLQQATVFPRKLRNLTMIDSNIVDLNYNNPSLELMKSLKSFYYKGNQSLELEMPNLKSLTANNSIYHNSCPLLERLTIDVYDQCYDNGFEIDYKKLKHLRVVQTVDRKYKEEIDALQLKSVDVHFFDLPTKENLILGLNDDCLLHLQKFLSAEDWMSLHECHPRFQQLRIKEYSFDQWSLEQNPLRSNWSYYTRIAPLVSYVKVEQFDEQDMAKVLPMFTNLNRVCCYLDCPEIDLSLFIQNTLRVLHIYFELLPNDQRSDLLCHISKIETLTELCIETLYCEFNVPDIPVGSLPRLRKLSFQTYYRPLNSHAFGAWLGSLNLSNITHFECHGGDGEFEIAAIPLMPKLEHLSIDFYYTISITEERLTQLANNISALTTLKELKVPLKGHLILPLIKHNPNLKVFRAPRDLNENVFQEIRTYLRNVNRKISDNFNEYF